MDSRAEKDTGGVADVAVDLTGEAVVEETEINAYVVCLGGLPDKRIVAQGRDDKAGGIGSAGNDIDRCEGALPCIVAGIVVTGNSP